MGHTWGIAQCQEYVHECPHKDLSEDTHTPVLPALQLVPSEVSCPVILEMRGPGVAILLMEKLRQTEARDYPQERG